MNKSFILYIVNDKNGFAREITVSSKDVSNARIIAEKLYINKDERIMTIYPKQ